MTDDRTHNDLGAKVSVIVDNALAELFELGGVDSKDAARVLLACQAILRIEDNEQRKKVKQYADSLIWDDDEDTGGAK